MGSVRFGHLRRSVGLLAVVMALTSIAPAGASLLSIRRTFGEVTFPRVRTGELVIPRGHADGRVRVIVGLPLAPLAAAYGRGLSGLGTTRKLDVTTSASRAYLARVVAAQRQAAARLLRAIPEARIGWRYQVVLDGLTVSLPVTKLPRLARLPFVRKIFPSVTYHLNTNKSPGVIGADELHAATGAFGDGIKIGIVDDGVDPTNPFLQPGGPDHPPTCGLSGVAPHAYLGNYRVFNVPTPIGQIANTPEIAAAFEAAVRDGMDVINFPGGGAETEPANDAMIDVVHNVAAAGVVPVISAGNDRDDFGMGTVGSPGSAPDAITVAAVSNTH